MAFRLAPAALLCLFAAACSSPEKPPEDPRQLSQSDTVRSPAVSDLAVSKPRPDDPVRLRPMSGNDIDSRLAQGPRCMLGKEGAVLLAATVDDALIRTADGYNHLRGPARVTPEGLTSGGTYAGDNLLVAIHPDDMLPQQQGGRQQGVPRPSEGRPATVTLTYGGANQSIRSTWRCILPGKNGTKGNL